MAGTEKRRGKRIAYNADIIFSVFNRKKHFTPYFNAYYDAFHRAHMHNCSAEGMFFDSDFELKPHSQLLLKVTDGDSMRLVVKVAASDAWTSDTRMPRSRASSARVFRPA